MKSTCSGLWLALARLCLLLLTASCTCPEPPEEAPSDLTVLIEGLDEERPSLTWEVFVQSDVVTIIARDGDQQAVAVFERL